MMQNAQQILFALHSTALSQSADRRSR